MHKRIQSGYYNEKNVKVFCDAINISGFIHPGQRRSPISHEWHFWMADAGFWNPDQNLNQTPNGSFASVKGGVVWGS